MNYSLHYKRLIERAPKTKPVTHITEGHHIVPRCIGGTNSDGIVYLTPEEHYIAHLLLIKIHPNKPKLIYAANMMTTNGVGQHRTKNKKYGWLRKKYSEQVKGKPKSKEHRKKLAESNRRRKGIPRTLEVKAKIGAARKGKTFVEQFGEIKAKEIMKKAVLTKIKNNSTGKGIPRPHMQGELNPSKKPEIREKMSNFALQKPYKCDHCGKYFNVGNYVSHTNALKRKGII